MPKQRDHAFILWFDEVTKDDIPLVGGKNANLGEMYQKLTHPSPKATEGKAKSKPLFPDEQIQVPYGYAVTAAAYRYFMKENGLDAKIKELLGDFNIHDIKQLEDRGQQARHAILSAKFPSDLEAEITAAYEEMAKKMKINLAELDVAVRSSATAEDLPDASFAGQQESYLNIKGSYELLEAIKKAFASLFTNRAISYRVDRKFDHFEIALSVAVQKMVRSDLGASGVMFTLDTDSGFRENVLINGAWGLGEFVVKGVVTPDEYVVFKPTLKLGFKSIINKKLGSKEKKLIYAAEGTHPTKEVAVADADRHQFALSEDQILKLAKWGCIIEDHYGRPMDIEWALDGRQGELYIVQARPETVHAQNTGTVLEEYVLQEKGTVLCQGAAVGAKIGQGKARLIKDATQISEFKPGEVLVTEITDPDWEPIMKIASAIVTNAGGRTSHAAIVSRELGIPAVVGCGSATEKIKNGDEITASCAEGEVGKVYAGLLKFKINRQDLTDFKPPKIDIKMIAADPELAFGYSFIPNKGVGLARVEFVISNFIKIHPNAIIDYKKLTDERVSASASNFAIHPSRKAMEDKEAPSDFQKATADDPLLNYRMGVKKQIDELTVGYSDKLRYYSDKFAYGVAQLAAAFYPFDVLLRFSDFKSNEYANLIGGKLYEPEEENPMLGWRGASRYYDPKFENAFALECQAVKKVREEMGLWNLSVMVPFCRTPEEGKKVIAEIKKNGLTSRITPESRKKKENGDLVEAMEIWVMAEIPSNILQVDEFAEIFDGFSIGSNDLTQLTLGLDRDNKNIAHIGNERNKSVHKLIHMLITEAHAKGLKVGICGQGPSDFPEFGEFLVKEGIDSISLNPDTVLKATLKIKEVEDKIGK